MKKSLTMGLIFKSLKIQCVFVAKLLEMGTFFWKIPRYGYLFGTPGYGLFFLIFRQVYPGGALTWKGGTGMCSPQDPLFTYLLPFASPSVEVQHRSKTPISKKNVPCFLQNQTFSENMVIFSCRSQNFATIFVKKLENFAKYSFSSPFFCWKSTHKTPLSRQSNHSQAPKFGNPSRTHLPEQKLSAPLPPGVYPGGPAR